LPHKYGFNFDPKNLSTTYTKDNKEKINYTNAGNRIKKRSK